MITTDTYRYAAGDLAEKASELAEFLALPCDYFSPAGAQHWYQVASRSEVEEHLKTTIQALTYCETRIAELTEEAETAREIAYLDRRTQDYHEWRNRD